MSRLIFQFVDPSGGISNNRSMLKALLVYDDYTELTSIESLLKKVGFDTIGITSEFSTTEKVLSFNPDIVISYGRGPKMTTLGVGRRLKEMSRWGGKSILIFPPGFKPNPQELIRTRMDMILEAPVPPAKLLQVIAKLMDKDEKPWLDKLAKVAPQDDVVKVKGSDSQGKKGKQDNVFVGGSNKAKEEKSYIGGSDSNNEDDSYISGDRSSREEDQRLKSHSSEEALQQKLKGQFTLDERDEKIKSGKTGSENSEKVKGFEIDGQDSQKLKGSAAKEKDHQSLEGPTKAPTAEESRVSRESKADLPPVIKAGSKEEEEVERLKAQDLNQPHFQEQLEEARKTLGEKIQNYKNLTKNISVSRESTLIRSKVRKEQSKLKKDWAQEKLEDQDELRREFTNALFKKTN